MLNANRLGLRNSKELQQDFSCEQNKDDQNHGFYDLRTVFQRKTCA